LRILSARIHFYCTAHLVAGDIGQSTRRKAMAEQALKTPPFAQPTQCRRYEGRVAIVTDATQGLGLVIARRLAEEGADIVACDIQEERLGRAAEDLQQGTNQRILAVADNLSEAGAAEALSRQWIVRGNPAG
jgi:2-polyprenyl-3-methyl-5-hydroxy-6-metoxy-1,4-benzoquinol methylase